MEDAEKNTPQHKAAFMEPSMGKRHTLYYDADEECRDISQKLFDKLDLDHNGLLDMIELECGRQLLFSTGIDSNRGAINKPIAAFGSPGNDVSQTVLEMWRHIDDDGNGTVDMHEWEDFIRGVYEIAGRRCFMSFAQRWSSAIHSRPEKGSQVRKGQRKNSTGNGQVASGELVQSTASIALHHQQHLRKGRCHLTQPAPTVKDKSPAEDLNLCVGAPSPTHSPCGSRAASPMPGSKKHAKKKTPKELQAKTAQEDEGSSPRRPHTGHSPAPHGRHEKRVCTANARQQVSDFSGAALSSSSGAAATDTSHHNPHGDSQAPAPRLSFCKSMKIQTISPAESGDMSESAPRRISRSISQPAPNPAVASHSNHQGPSDTTGSVENNVTASPRSKQPHPAATHHDAALHVVNIVCPCAKPLSLPGSRRSSHASEGGLETAVDDVLHHVSATLGPSWHIVNQQPVQEEKAVSEMKQTTEARAPQKHESLRGKQARQQVSAGGSGRSHAVVANKNKPQTLATEAPEKHSVLPGLSAASLESPADIEAFTDDLEKLISDCQAEFENTQHRLEEELHKHQRKEQLEKQHTAGADLSEAHQHELEKEILANHDLSDVCLHELENEVLAHEVSDKRNKADSLDMFIEDVSAEIEASPAGPAASAEIPPGLIGAASAQSLDMCVEDASAEMDSPGASVSGSIVEAPHAQKGGHHRHGSAGKIQAVGKIQATARHKAHKESTASHKESTASHKESAASLSALSHHPSTHSKKSPRLEKNIHQSRAEPPTQQELMRSEQPLITIEEVWEVMTTVQGYVNTRLPVKDLMEFYVESKETGLGPTLATLVPQESFTDATPPEDLSPGEFLEMCMIFVDHDDGQVSISEWAVREQLADVRDYCRMLSFKDLTIERHASVTLRKFKHIVQMLAILLRIDETYILSHFMWIRTGRFEATDALAALVMERCSVSRRKADEGPGLFLHDATPKMDLHVLYEGLASGDVSRLCCASEVVDSKGKVGIPFSHVGVIFQNLLQHAVELVKARAASRSGPSRKGSVFEQVQRAVRNYEELRSRIQELKNQGYDVRGFGDSKIRGRTEFSILIEHLFNAVKPRAVHKSPLLICLAVLGKTPTQIGKLF